MQEKEFITTIKSVLESDYIGDDCAYLKDLGIVITQDNLVEDVHFSMEYISPFQLGYKSIMVNVSDVVASGADVKYLTVGLSLPKNIGVNFVEDFYKGAKEACPNDVEIVGGDITGADKIMVSVCALGKVGARNISSRSNARVGYKVVVVGKHGSSAGGLKILQENLISSEILVNAHLEPKAKVEEGAWIGKNVIEPYAMMDTSDGLMEAFSTIANSSGVLLEVDFSKIPYDKELENFDNYKDLILYGGEDYGLVAVIPKKYNIGVPVGYVKSGLGVNLVFENIIEHYSKEEVDKNLFNHF